MTEPTITAEGLWNGKLVHFSSLPSTNTWAIENAASCGHGDIILTDDQTQGRGRFERTWSSAVGCSLTLSFVIDAIHFPCIKKENYAQIAALAVWQLLAGLKIDARFKWPNDIMTERGKICGILAENISDSSVVVGLGVNMALEHESADITKPFTSIHHEIDQVPAIDELTRSLAKCLESAFEECRESGFEHLRDTWKAHDYLQGKTITIRTASDELTGTYAGLSEEGLLLLEVDGETRQFHSGDVTLAAS